MANWKMQISRQVCGDDSPLDGARDLFCIFSLTSGGTVAHGISANPHVDAFQCIISMLRISINMDPRCNNLRVSFKRISSQSPASSVLLYKKY